MRRRPYAVILLDEIEKAHREVFNILLQVLEDGRLTDGHGRTVDFKNALVVMTSNIGSDVIMELAGREDAEWEVDARVKDALKQYFRLKSRVKNILSKLGANDRTQAVTIALKRGIIELQSL